MDPGDYEKNFAYRDNNCRSIIEPNESILEDTLVDDDRVNFSLSPPSSSESEYDTPTPLPLDSNDGTVNDHIQRQLFDGCVDEQIILDKGRLRTVAFSSVDGETAAVRDRITVQLERRNAHLIHHGVSSMRIEARVWQVAVAAEILLKRDTLVITATGSGKTMCFLLLLIADATASVLVVSPLLGLMDDQVGLAISM
jgi:hypothetical protein